MSARPIIISSEDFTHSDDIFYLGLSQYEFSNPLVIVPWQSVGGKFENIDLPKNIPILYNGYWPASFFQYINKHKPKTLFTISNHLNYQDPQETVPYPVKEDIQPKNKDLRLSFIGWNCGPIRERLFEIYKDRTTFIPHTTFKIRGFRKEYCDILGRSRFSLCPRGLNTGSYRFWESLKCGSIPVLISDDYKLPKNWDWDSTIIRFPEKGLKFTHKIDAEINKALNKEEEMRKNCIKAYNFFCLPENLCKYIDSLL